MQVLLSHYFQPDNPQEVAEAALDDWVSALAQFSRQAIDRACSDYVRKEPRRRPTPGSIRELAMHGMTSGGVKADRGDRSKLSFDELDLLENKILPTARRWLTIPDLREHGQKTLAYWGET